LWVHEVYIVRALKINDNFYVVACDDCKIKDGGTAKFIIFSLFDSEPLQLGI
jgi:hypothetical protein